MTYIKSADISGLKYFFLILHSFLECVLFAKPRKNESETKEDLNAESLLLSDSPSVFLHHSLDSCWADSQVSLLLLGPKLPHSSPAAISSLPPASK